MEYLLQKEFSIYDTDTAKYVCFHGVCDKKIHLETDKNAYIWQKNVKQL